MIVRPGGHPIAVGVLQYRDRDRTFAILVASTVRPRHADAEVARAEPSTPEQGLQQFVEVLPQRQLGAVAELAQNKLLLPALEFLELFGEG